MPDLAPGTYTVSVPTANYMGSTQSITVTAGTNVTADFRLTPRGAIAGKVTNSANGQPLPGVTVYAATAQGIAASAVTLADGSYRLEDLDDLLDRRVDRRVVAALEVRQLDGHQVRVPRGELGGPDLQVALRVRNGLLRLARAVEFHGEISRFRIILQGANRGGFWQ